MLGGGGRAFAPDLFLHLAHLSDFFRLLGDGFARHVLDFLTLAARYFIARHPERHLMMFEEDIEERAVELWAGGVIELQHVHLRHLVHLRHSHRLTIHFHLVGLCCVRKKPLARLLQLLRVLLLLGGSFGGNLF